MDASTGWSSTKAMSFSLAVPHVATTSASQIGWPVTPSVTVIIGGYKEMRAHVPGVEHATVVSATEKRKVASRSATGEPYHALVRSERGDVHAIEHRHRKTFEPSSTMAPTRSSRPARKSGVNPVAYLTDVLTCVQSHPKSRVHELLPHRWKPPDPPPR
jgi:hypothetical protein